MEKWNIQVPITIDSNFVADILTTAFEGGSTHWVDSVENVKVKSSSKYYSDVVAEGGEVNVWLIESIEEDGEEVYTLDINKFIAGFTLYLSNTCDEMISLDASTYDGDMADCILQYALFGEVVFD